ncbi:MAG TPA: hypothetical protein VMT30_02150 [Candidatus Saccharimonadia bacterium]|nr:hypothetical protein [Candidatus Saccharimonadia bacterium]
MIVYPRVVVERIGKVIGNTRVDQATIQFECMKPVIEKLAPHSLLDLGCGWAIIDIFIAQHAPVTEIHLVDGTGDGTVEKRSGFKDDTKAWNDVRFGAAIVRENLGHSVEVFEHFSEPEKINTQVDLIISCRSWGHHYPISIYSETVMRCVKPGGFVITDIRTNTDGLEQLKKMGLEIVEQIPDKSSKCTRWLLKDMR